MIQNFMEIWMNNANVGQGSMAPPGMEPGDVGPPGMGQGGLDVMGIGTCLAIIVGVANICLLIALLFVYLKTYRQLKSKFTMGLLVFASLLLLQNVVSTLFLTLSVVLGVSSNGLEIGRPQFPLSSINIIQLIALSILLKITWE